MTTAQRSPGLARPGARSRWLPLGGLAVLTLIPLVSAPTRTTVPLNSWPSGLPAEIHDPSVNE